MYVSIPFILLSCLFAYRSPALSGSGITDPDYYWHVGYGEWIIANGRLPTEDFWSWTFAGHPYRLTQWLGEVFMGGANLLAGEMGTSVLAAMLVTLTMAASYRAARCYLDNRLAALTLAIACNSILVPLACRPHQFTHLGLAVLAWIVAEYQTGNRFAIRFIPFLFAAWVNLHGGYAFGLVYLGMVCGTLALDAYLKHDQETLRFFVAPLAIATGVGFLATLLNPYGWGAWQYAIEITNLKSSSTGIVDEWASVNIKTEVGMSFFMVVSVVMASMAMSKRRAPLSQVLLAIGLCAIGWSAVRLSLMVTMLLVPLIAPALRDTAFYALVFDGEARKYDRPIHVLKGVAVVSLVLASSLGMAGISKTTENYMLAKMPVEEVEFIRKHNISGKLLNTPETGGYLIRQLGYKVSIDTRLDLYGDRSLFEYLFASRGDAGWKDYVVRHDPDIILMNNKASITHLLADSGLYRPVFQGISYAVFVRHDRRPDLETIRLVRPNAEVLERLK